MFEYPRCELILLTDKKAAVILFLRWHDLKKVLHVERVPDDGVRNL